MIGNAGGSLDGAMQLLGYAAYSSLSDAVRDVDKGIVW